MSLLIARTCRPSSWLAVVWLGCITLAWQPLEARAGDLKLEARLIWGTNEQVVTNSSCKPIDTPLTGKLAKLLRWKSFFEVSRQEVTLQTDGVKEIKLSDKCIIEVKDLGEQRVKVKLFGDGNLVSTTAKTLLKGDWLVLAGGSRNESAWFVVLKTKP